MNFKIKCYEKIKLIIIPVTGFLLFIAFNNHSKNRRNILNEKWILDTKTGRLYFPFNEVYLDISDYKKNEQNE